MGQDAFPDRERTFALAKRTNELLHDYGPSAAPRAYAVWYAYVSGDVPLLNDAVKRLTAEKGKLTELDIDHLHESYLDGQRHAGEVGVVSRTVLAELAAVTEALDLSLGSTHQYGESLSRLTRTCPKPRSAARGSPKSSPPSPTRPARSSPTTGSSRPASARAAARSKPCARSSRRPGRRP